MRFLYSHRTRSADGQRVHIRELTDALRDRGHEIFIAGTQNMQPAQSGSVDASSKNNVRSWLPAPIYEPVEYAYSLPAYWRLARQCAATKPDVLYERYNLFFHAGARLHRKTGLPMILEVNAPLAEERARHDGLFWKKFAQRSERTIWRAADMVLPVSKALADRVSEAGVPDHKIEIVPNGASQLFLEESNPAIIRNRYSLEDKLVFGFSGFVRDWHGVDRAVRFLGAQNRSDLHLLIVGDGPARPGLEKLAADLGVTDQMIITGAVQRDEMPDHVAAFDIALLPAVVDYASPLKLMEYMAQGKAIAAPDQENIREILNSGEDALLFSTDEADAFDKMLLELIENAPLRARLGAAARAKLVSRDSTWSGNAARVENIAKKLIERKT